MTHKVCRTCNGSGICDRCGGYEKNGIKGCEACDYTGECPYCKEVEQDAWFTWRQNWVEYHD